LIDTSTLRVTLRTLARHRGFSTVAILSLALAIALNTTMYSALDAMIDPQIDARRPDHIYTIAYFGDARRKLHHSTIESALRAGVAGFESASGSRSASFWGQAPLAENGSRYYRVTPIAVRMNYFEFLGTRAREGRTFLPRDEGTHNAVISDRLANKLFPDESPVGRTLTLDGEGYVVIGVVRRNTTFALLSDDIWIPQRAGASPVPITLMRFREKISPYDIGDQLKIVAARLAIAADEVPGKTAFRALSYMNQRLELTPFHLALACAVVAVLLVACANLANLQLARGLARSRELALRSAVGASRGRLVGHLMLETGAIAIAGLLLGVFATLWGIHVIRATIPAEVGELMIEPQVSWGMFAFAAIAALVCLFFVGLLPALRISRVDPDRLLKAGAGTGANREHRRRYGLMVMAQIGFSLPVLVGAIVLLRSATKLHSRDFLVRNLYGYDPGPIVVANVPFSPPERVTSVLVGDLAAQLTAGAKSVRGVIDATVYHTVEPEGRRVVVDDADGHLREEPAHLWGYRVVSPTYFRVFGLPIVQGRGFTETETDGRAVVMDARTAEYLWKHENPIGRAIKFGDNKSKARWHTVVGIVGDLRDTNAIRLRDPTANFRLNQVYRVVTPADSLVLRRWVGTYFNIARGSLTLYARVNGNAELAAVRMQRQLRAVTSANPPTVVRMEDNLGVAQERTRQDFAASLFSAFALIGIALVAIGLYGIVAHSVAERTRELAVRISLGATARDILHSVLREGNALILAGVAIGLLLTKYSVFWLAGYIPEDESYNALLFAAIAGLLFGIAVFAAFVPAWRATKIDPVEALRHE
jgi:putative ABC transport system permease protein